MAAVPQAMTGYVESLQAGLDAGLPASRRITLAVADQCRGWSEEGWFSAYVAGYGEGALRPRLDRAGAAADRAYVPPVDAHEHRLETGGATGRAAVRTRRAIVAACVRVRVVLCRRMGHAQPDEAALGAIGRVVQQDQVVHRRVPSEAGLSRGWVSSPSQKSRPPETNIEIATNQKAASAAPVRLAASPRPSAPMA